MTKRARIGVVSPMSGPTRKHLMAELADEFDCLVIADYDANWWDESWVTSVARAAESLGLPGPSSRRVRAMRNKMRVRQAFSALAGVKDLSGIARDRDHVLEIGARIGYPVIVKPTGLAGSRG